MRGIVALLALAGTTAAPPARAADQAEIVEICATYSRIAGSVMNLRQDGVLMTEVISAGTKPPTATILRIIEGAFEYPHYSTEKHREQAIVDYSNEVMSRCLKDLRPAIDAPEPKP